MGLTHSSWVALRLRSRAHTTYMTACGRFLVFSLLNLGQVLSCHPWVILAIVAGRDAFRDLTLEQIRSFSESDAMALVDWFSIAPKTRVVPASPSICKRAWTVR